MRLLWLVWFTFTQAFPLLLAFRRQADDDEGPFLLPEFATARSRLQHHDCLVDHVRYQVYTNIRIPNDYVIKDERLVSELYDHIIYGKPPDRSDEKAAMLKSKLQWKKDDMNRNLLVNDGLRKPIQASLKLKAVAPLTERQQQERMAIGGMRNPRYAMGKIPGHSAIGPLIRDAVNKYFDSCPAVEAKLIASIGKKKDEVTMPTQEETSACMNLVREVLPFRPDDESLTQLNAAFLGAWVAAAGDPDHHVIDWLRRGAPAGILHHAGQAGIFPPAGDEGEAAKERALQEHYHGFKNYTSMEESSHGKEVLQELVTRGYVKKFSTLAAARRYLQAEPVLAKLALIETVKDGVVKYRLILDCRVSGSNDQTRKSERILLPKVWDVIRDVLHFHTILQPGEGVELMVCDFTDAFYMVPLAGDEQRYYAAMYDNEVYVWGRVAQGSLNGPNIFGRLSALVGRLSQSFLR